MSLSALGEAAFSYAARGIKVFPCKLRGKEPLTKHGFKDATTDETQIREWWTKWPDANIGAPTGANGWSVIDIDSDSPEAIFEISGRYGIDIAAPMVRTGKGRQLYYNAVTGLGPSVRVAGDLVDVRSGESYVVLPPSVHPNGREYRWSIPLCDPLPEMPAATLERLTSGTAAKGPAVVGPEGDAILEGERNHMLTRIAGRLRHVGASEGAILAQLKETNAARCKPPLADSEIDAIARSVIRYAPARDEAQAIRDALEEELATEGPRLFEDIKAAIREHFFFEQEWHYTIAGLYVLECTVFKSLPAVFYLFFPGSFGTGKTNILGLIATLTGSVSFENVSVAALAHELGDGKPVCIDEYDVTRGKDMDEVRNALVRQGYKRTAAPYTRYDVTTKKNEYIPIFGPKALTFRGSIETALQSRGYTIPTVKAKGEDGYRYVVNNLWPHIAGLPKRIARWGRTARATFPDTDLEVMTRSPELHDEVKAICKELGANRSAELAIVAVLVARMAGLDVVVDLKKANALNELETSASESEDREELLEVLGDITKAQMTREFLGEAKIVRHRQRMVRDELNRRKAERHEKTLTTPQFAALRREAGINEEWLVHHGGSLVWNLPIEWVKETLLVPSAEAIKDEPIPPVSPETISPFELSGERPEGEDTLPAWKRRKLDEMNRETTQAPENGGILRGRTLFDVVREATVELRLHPDKPKAFIRNDLCERMSLVLSEEEAGLLDDLIESLRVGERHKGEADP